MHDYVQDFPDLQKPGQGKWLQDDYVKFYRLTIHLLKCSGAGAMGLITNNGFLDNATFRGMRKHTLDHVPFLSFVDLRGSVMKRERADDGSQDENVFDIQQSVAITIGAVKRGDAEQVAHSEIVGSRANKYHWLATHALSDSSPKPIEPKAPFFLFVPSDAEIGTEYFRFPSVARLFNQNGDPAPGIVTTHDEFAISWTKDEQQKKVESLLATRTESQARQMFRLCTQNQWSYARSKQELPLSGWRDKIVRVLYRPFDIRWTVYDSNIAVHRRERVTKHMVGQKNGSSGFCVGNFGGVIALKH